MTARLAANECSILIVNSTKYFASCGSQDIFQWLSRLTQKLLLPTHLVDFSNHSELEMQILLSAISKSEGQQRRLKVLIAGVDLEESVSLFTLEALAFGVEVFLLADLIQVMDERTSRYCWDRLVQAGAVPTTIVQVALELAFTDPNQMVTAEVREMLAAFREMQLQ